MNIGFLIIYHSTLVHKSEFEGCRRVGFPRVGYLFVLFHRGAIPPGHPLLIWGIYNLETGRYMDRTPL